MVSIACGTAWHARDGNIRSTPHNATRQPDMQSKSSRVPTRLAQPAASQFFDKRIDPYQTSPALHPHFSRLPRPHPFSIASVFGHFLLLDIWKRDRLCFRVQPGSSETMDSASCCTCTVHAYTPDNNVQSK